MADYDRTENGLTVKQNMKLEMRALREGWPIPEERKKAIIEYMCDIAAGKSKDGAKIPESTSVKAFNSLVMANKPVNQANIQFNNFGDPIDDLLEAGDVVEGLLVDNSGSD